MCGSCMGSCDFLWHYQLHTAPMRVDGSSDTSSVEVTKERRDGNGIDTDTSTGTSTSIGAGGSCELARRKAVLNQTASSSDRKVAAGFLDNNWRSQLCTCSVCMVRNATSTYTDLQVGCHEFFSHMRNRLIQNRQFEWVSCACMDFFVTTDLQIGVHC